MGDSGDDVKADQQRLLKLGYWMSEADGKFGSSTRQAVYAIQKAAGLERTGTIGKQTQAAIDRGVRPKAKAGGDGLEIDLKRQLLLVVRDGQVKNILNVSSGNGESYTAPIKNSNGVVVGRSQHRATTPTGSYTMQFQRDELWKSTLELGSLYRPKYFNGGIAVHGADSVPPYPASHGCVRVTNAAMDWIWKNKIAELKSRVTVY